MPEPLHFYFDFSSPYGYLAAERIEGIAARHGRDVRWRPILLGPMFKETGNGPLLAQPIKGDYSKMDLERTARHFGIPFLVPDPFPVGTLAAARGYYWQVAQDRMKAIAFAKAVYRAYFAEGRNINKPDVVVEVAGEVGLDVPAFQAAINEPAIKEQLKAEIDSAMKRGVFGSPMVFVDGEPFWGADRLDMVDAWLSRGGW